MNLINHQRATDAATAFVEALGWPLTVGHRMRPRQGCTCEQPGCPTPGAHPRPGAPLLRDARTAWRAMEEAPGGALIVPTVPFDALVLPKTFGMAAMITLDAKVGGVPCIVSAETVTLLVLPATGRYALRGDGVPGEVRTGTDGWVALPPSTGQRWDTFPWIEGTRTPRQLLPGTEVGAHFGDALMHYRSSLTTAEVTA